MKILPTIKFKIFLLTMVPIIASCDKHCDIRLKNEMSREIKIMTRRTGYQNELLQDTVTLRTGEEFKIGDCINCSVIDDIEIDYEQITLDLQIVIIELESKEDIIKYIDSWGGPKDCVVKVIK